MLTVEMLFGINDFFTKIVPGVFHETGETL